MFKVVAKSIVETTENNTYILYSRVSVCTQLHQEQIISLAKFDFKSDERLSVVLYELGQKIKVAKPYLSYLVCLCTFVVWLWFACLDTTTSRITRSSYLQTPTEPSPGACI